MARRVISTAFSAPQYFSSGVRRRAMRWRFFISRSAAARSSAVKFPVWSRARRSFCAISSEYPAVTARARMATMSASISSSMSAIISWRSMVLPIEPRSAA